MYLDIYDIILMFYAIEEMMAYVNNDPYVPFFRSRESFCNDLLAMKIKFDSAFAKIMYDYMIYTIMGELIDSRFYSDETFDKFLGHDFKYVPKNALETEYKRIDPEDLLARANEVFNAYWNNLFGGEPWAKAVNLTKMFGKVPDAMFIDGLIDLQHNTDSILSKENPYWEVKKSQNKKLITLLNRKRKNKLWITQNIIAIQFFPRVLKDLITRFVALYVPNWEYERIFSASYWDHNSNIYFNELLAYKPTEYTCEFILGHHILSEDIDDEYTYY